MKSFLLGLVTGKDNVTPDIARLGGALGILSFIAYGGWHVFHNHVFDPLSYGGGLGGLFGGLGLGIGAKAKTEPGD